jgi:hypothetical protein
MPEEGANSEELRGRRELPEGGSGVRPPPMAPPSQMSSELSWPRLSIGQGE